MEKHYSLILGAADSLIYFFKVFKYNINKPIQSENCVSSLGIASAIFT